MRHILKAALTGACLVYGISSNAQAADITVFAPGIATAGLKQLADNWTLKTGNKVTITGSNVGRILDNLNKGVPADLVLLPPDNLNTVYSRLKSDPPVHVGRALFGMAVKAGGSHPDISTVEKFAAALKEVGTIGYPDPAVGSLSGAMVVEMLKRPEFADVTGKPLRENSAQIVLKGDAPFSVGAISEETPYPGVELVGILPAELKLHIDLSAAIPANAESPADGLSFLKYITSSAAAAIWHDCGIDANDTLAQSSRLPCTMPAR